MSPASARSGGRRWSGLETLLRAAVHGEPGAIDQVVAMRCDELCRLAHTVSRLAQTVA